MASEEHLKILKEGIASWNKWRSENPDIRPNFFGAHFVEKELREANLSHSDLISANLHKAKLFGADLRKADLVRAWLTNAQLYSANLSESKLNGANFFQSDLKGANLTYADLTGADFTAADLTGANLTGTTLARTNFSDAQLVGATLENANLGGTILGNVALNGARGLDTCIHSRPSIIDHQTLARSGRLPLNFIRGCGVPEIIIEFILPLFSDPIQFQSCFISYSSTDQLFAERLYADLQQNG
jgi:hypothetical protein